VVAGAIRKGRGTIFAAVLQAEAEYRQQNQPEGVPPLSLTGERTLPDVPEENYWFSATWPCIGGSPSESEG